MLLSSPHNPTLKQLQKLLHKSKARKTLNRFVIEGEREVLRAIAGGYAIEAFFVLEGAVVSPETQKMMAQTQAKHYELPPKLLHKVAVRSTTEQMVAVAVSKEHSLSQLKLPKKAFVLVIEAAEKPGNIGAILRTAAAFQIDAVLIADPKTDLYNPHIIRASLGGLFFVPVAEASSAEILAYLNEQNMAIATAALAPNNTKSNQFKYQLPCAVVMGSEDRGVSSLWLEAATHIVKIPMTDHIDSLNLSVSAGILMYEALAKNGRLKDSL